MTTIPTTAELWRFRWTVLIGVVLVASGGAHLALLAVSGSEWEGAVSLRKPGLFGVSAGVTVWSIAWALAQCQPRRGDERLAGLLSIGLLTEVALITLQFWRGVPSHFNRVTTVDAMIELVMLGLILMVSAGIGWLCWRSRRLRPMAESRALATRGGLGLLLTGCVLGLLATIAGEVNLAAGRPPEIWGQSGVLKYPHGAVLHAIQTLPLLSLALERLKVALAADVLRLAIAAHVGFVFLAMWQTMSGRARVDLDLMGVAASVVVALLFAMLIATAPLAVARPIAKDS